MKAYSFLFTYNQFYRLYNKTNLEKAYKLK